MSDRSAAPDVASLEIPIDAWTAPFWEYAAQQRLVLPCCGSCRRFRWPPGPFCPQCQSQNVDWAEPGLARLYSFTIVRRPATNTEGDAFVAPGLVEFPQADGVRLPAAIIDATLSALAIGAELHLCWLSAANARLPAFRIG